MKKRNLIVALSGMGALAVAVGAVGTAAWYTASATATVNNAAAVTGSLTTAASTQDMAGSFTITPAAIGDQENIALTDNQGKTYVSVSNGSGSYTAYEATAEHLFATYSLSATVTYSGPLSDQAAIQALWLSSVASVTLTLSCTGATGTPVLGDAPSAADIHYITSSTNFADKEDGNVITLNDSDFTFGAPTGPDAQDKYSATTGVVSFGSVLVAIRGYNGVVWDATHSPSYTMQCAATHA